jgi:hypothetical protein
MTMLLMCPNCQKDLTVPEQYAGQKMKCPHCTTVFNVPALPAPVASADPGQPAFAANPAPTPAFAPAELPAPTPEPVPAFNMPAATVAPAPAPIPFQQEPEPAFKVNPAPAPTVQPMPNPVPPATAPQATQTQTSTPQFSTSQNAPAGYANTCAMTFSPAVIQYIPAVSLFLIFVLSFFTWVGIYPGGIPAATQGPWSAAFGMLTVDADLTGGEREFKVVTAKDVQDAKDAKDAKDLPVSTEPSASVLILFYLLPFLLVGMVVSIAVVALPFIKVPLPPAVQQLLPMKWLIVMGLNVVLLLLLTLQMLLSFSLETTFAAWVERQPGTTAKNEQTPSVKKAQAIKGEFSMWIQRTIWLKLAYLLQLLATASAIFIWWSERRGHGKPTPVLELRW